MFFYTKPNLRTIYSHLPQSQKDYRNILITVIFHNLCYWANPNLSPSTAIRSFKGISGIFSLSRCSKKHLYSFGKQKKSTFCDCLCPKQRLVLSASTSAGIRSAFTVVLRHQGDQSWAGHSLRSNTAPSWKLRSCREEHPGQSPPSHLQVLCGKPGELVYKLSFLSPGKANNTKSFQRDVLTLQHPACHHSNFYFAILSYFPSFLRSLQWAAPCGSCFEVSLAPSAT